MSGAPSRAGWLVRLLAPRTLRWSLVELCRRTTLDGWDELQAAAAEDRGVALLASAADDWPLAARALAGWAGPLHLALPAGERDRRLARLACAGGGSAPRPAAGPDSVARAFAAGEKVLFVIEAGCRQAPPPAVPEGVPALAVAVERSGRGRYRLVIRRRPPPAR